MEIMRWVKEQGEKKGRRYLFWVPMFISASYLALWKVVYDVWPLPETLAGIAWDSHFLWHILFAVALAGIICVWMYYAPVVCRDLSRLKDAFPNSGYHILYGRFEGWLEQFKRWPRKIWPLKVLYMILWGLYFFCFFLYYWAVLCQYFQNYAIGYKIFGFLAFFILTLTIIFLNYSSCYICIVFVYFLIRICRLDKDSPLSYLQEAPSATFGLQLLKHTANTICLYFLLDSLFCMVSFYCFRQIVNVKDTPMVWFTWILLFYIAIFFVGFGLISCVSIVSGSRICLRRLHNEWRFRSFKKYAAKKRKDPENAAYGQAMEKLATDKVSAGLLDLLIPIGALATNIVTICTRLLP